MKRKVIAFALTIAAVFAFTACGQQSQPAAQDQQEPAQEAVVNEPSNSFEERVGKTTFESYDEIISLLEGDEAYAYATVKGYDGEVLFVATENFDDMLGHFATIECTPYTVKANGVTADSLLFSSSTSTPVAIDEEGIIYTASHRSVEESCYGDNGTDTPALMILATVQAEELDENGNPKTVTGFVRTKNSLVDDDLTDIASDDIETYDRMFNDYYEKAQVLSFTRVNGDTPQK